MDKKQLLKRVKELDHKVNYYRKREDMTQEQLSDIVHELEAELQRVNSKKQTYENQESVSFMIDTVIPSFRFRYPLPLFFAFLKKF